MWLTSLSEIALTFSVYYEFITFHYFCLFLFDFLIWIFKTDDIATADVDTI